MSSQIQPNLLRRLNERKVIEVIQANGPSSRADVTRQSGISAPTVSKAVVSLIDAGLLEEIDAPQTALGRPGRLLCLGSSDVQIIGVVIDARRCWVGSAGFDGKIRTDTSPSFNTPGTYDALISKIVEHALPMMQTGKTTLGVGVSVPGLINKRTQTTLLSPNLHVTDNHTIGADLSERLGVECLIMQESHALCLGEKTYGQAKQLDDFAVLDVSTGLGMGVMNGGRLLDGHSGLACELGHITVDVQGKLCGCGNHGCLETLATESAFVQAVAEDMGRVLDIDQIIHLIRTGEYQATEHLRKNCEYLAIALAAVINVFNPTTLFVYGKIFDAQDGLFSQLLELTEKRTLRPSFADCTIQRTTVNKQLGAVAGIVHHLTAAVAPTLE